MHESSDAAIVAAVNKEAQRFALSRSTLDFIKGSGRDLMAKVCAFRTWQKSRIDQDYYTYTRALAEPPRARTELVMEDGRREAGINFSSQDYLSLASHPRIIAAAKKALDAFGAHSAGSTALAGNTVAGTVLEQQLAQFLGYRHACLFPTGWAAGFGVIKALIRETDIVLLDQLAHNCLQEGAMAATPNVHRFRHLDNDHAATKLAQLRAESPDAGIMVVTETVFSMDSDSPDLQRLQALCREHSALLLVDVAHDLGCMGPTGLGQLEIQSVAGEIDLLIGSFSKTFASNGGFVASHHEALSHYLRFYSPANTFSNSLSPVQVAVVAEALRIVSGPDGADRRRRLLRNVSTLRDALMEKGATVLGQPSPLIPVLLGREEFARRAARHVGLEGVLTNLVEFPAVKKNQARLRLQVMAEHAPGDCEDAAARIVRALAYAREEMRQGES